MAQIAEKAGVSTVTVSRALRGVGRMKPDTRAAIRKHAREMGYPLDQGVFRRVSRSRGIGEFQPRLLMPRFQIRLDSVESAEFDTNHPQTDIFHGVQDRLKRLDGRFESERFQNVEEVIDACKRLRITGLLVSQPLPYQWLKELCKIPTVMFGPHDHYTQLTLDSVQVHEPRAAASILDALYREGHRRVAWFGLLDNMLRTGEFIRAIDPHRTSDRLLYTSFALRHAAWANLAWCQPGEQNQSMLLLERDWENQSLNEVVEEGLDRLLKSSPAPTAVVTSSDSMAFEVVRAARARGFQVPGDLSVVGYGFGKRYLKEGLTQVRPAHRLMGRAAVELLERRLAMPEAPPVAMQIETTFHRGKTLGPPSK